MGVAILVSAKTNRTRTKYLNMHISLLSTTIGRNPLLNYVHEDHQSCKSKINIRESLPRQSKSFEALLSFTLN